MKTNSPQVYLLKTQIQGELSKGGTLLLTCNHVVSNLTGQTRL